MSTCKYLLCASCEGDLVREKQGKLKIAVKGYLTGGAMIWYHPTCTLLGAAINEEPWCSGLTCLPVTQKIAGSNPVGSGLANFLSQVCLSLRRTRQLLSACVKWVKMRVGV